MNLDTIYAQHADKYLGTPEKARVPDAYLRKMNRPVPSGTSWEEFVGTCVREDAEAAAMNDLAAPLWLPEDKHGWCGIDLPAEDDRIRLRQACAVPWGDAVDLSGLLDWMAKWSPQWISMPLTVTEKNDDFAFSRLRCALAGGGLVQYRTAAGRLADLWPGSPLSADETPEAWLESLQAAHKTCGWPTTLLLARWHALPDAMGGWLDACAWAHVAKHCRRDGNTLVILHRGSREVVLAPKTSRSIGQWKTALAPIMRALGGGHPKSNKYAALLQCLNQLGLDDIPAREPTTALPGSILHGPWSTLAPGVAVDSEPFQPECRLEGVWQAKAGRIGVYEGDASDVLDWAWNLEDARTPERRAQQAQFERMMPRTYEIAYPSDILAQWFPHWILPQDKIERLAYQSMVDAVFIAAVQRADRDTLQTEYPLVTILAASPTAEESTNQGKGMLAQAIGGAFALGLPLIKALNSTSAPDFRAAAGTIRRYGTIALDEFQMPASQAHPLSRDNLQTLCTGGRVASGLAYENEAELRLRHSIVVNAKWLDLAADLKNRALPLFLGPLPDDQRAKVHIKDMVDSGEAGLRLRLAAVALAETIRGLPALPTTQHSWRFTTHRGIAAVLLMQRCLITTEEAAKALDALGADLIDTLTAHQMEADASGLSASTTSGTNLRVSWPAFWVGVDATSMANIVGAVQQSGERRHGEQMVPIGDLIRLRLEQSGIPSHAYARILPLTMGADIRASNGAVLKAFSDGVRSFFSAHLTGSTIQWVPLPGDLSANWECLIAPRALRASDPSGRTLMCGLRQRK